MASRNLTAVAKAIRDQIHRERCDAGFSVFLNWLSGSSLFCKEKKEIYVKLEIKIGEDRIWCEKKMVLEN